MRETTVNTLLRLKAMNPVGNSNKELASIMRAEKLRMAEKFLARGVTFLKQGIAHTPL